MMSHPTPTLPEVVPPTAPQTGDPGGRRMVVAFFFGVADLTGAPKMGWNIARSFLKNGHRVIAVVGSRPAKDASVIDRLQADGVEIVPETGFEKAWSFSLARRCTRALQEKRVDLIVSVIQIDVKIAAVVARSLNVPFVVMGQSLTTFFGLWPVRRAKAWVFGRLVRRRADLVIASSSAVAEQFKREHRIAAVRLVTISNCIDTRGFPARDNLPGVKDQPVGLLTVGRLDVQKGQDLLLEAMEQLPPGILERCSVSLAGGETISSPSSVAFAGKLRQQAERPKLAGRIKFLGWRDDIPSLLSKCDIYVHPARWEGLPLAVLEAMAASAPVIFTDCFGELEGFVQGQHGYRVPVGNVDALARALETVIALPAEARKQMGLRARELVLAHYDIAVLGKRFVERCELLLANAPPR
jgi:glycosyltransferase involved in cell wall biosynthesis